MLGHLRNIAVLFHVQRSSRHKNCKDIFYPGFSKQNITSVHAPTYSREKFYWWTCLLIMYYIASLAKFGHPCSMVWARRQGQWKSKNFSLSFSEEAAKILWIVLQCIFGHDFLSPCATFPGIKKFPVLPCLVTLVIWHSCYCAYIYIYR